MRKRPYTQTLALPREDAAHKENIHRLDRSYTVAYTLSRRWRPLSLASTPAFALQGWRAAGDPQLCVALLVPLLEEMSR